MTTEIDLNDLLKTKLLEALSEKKQIFEALPEEKVSQIKEKLLNSYSALCESYSFEVGQLIEWKDGLKNKARPRSGEPAIVINIYDEPIFDSEKDSGTPYFKEPLDMVIGVIEEKPETLLFFHVDSRRFKPI